MEIEAGPIGTPPAALAGRRGFRVLRVIGFGVQSFKGSRVFRVFGFSRGLGFGV